MMRRSAILRIVDFGGRLGLSEKQKKVLIDMVVTSHKRALIKDEYNYLSKIGALDLFEVMSWFYSAFMSDQGGFLLAIGQLFKASPDEIKFTISKSRKLFSMSSGRTTYIARG